MSDRQEKNIEQLAQETAAAGDSMLAGAGPDEGTEGGSAEPVTAFARRPESAAPQRSSAPGWTALLLALVVAAGVGWSTWEQQRRDAQFSERLQALETSGRDAGLEEMNQRWQRQLDAAVQPLQAANRELGDRLAQALADLQEQLARQSAELARYGATDRDDWLLAEAQYLLRLANQRLLMAGDAAGAEALLGSADSILLQLDDVRLHEVRAAVAADLAAVRAVPGVDVEGIYLRLAALVEQAGSLAIFQLPGRVEQVAPAPEQDWRGRLRQGYEAGLAKLSQYIVIRRRDVPVQALMDPQWEGLVRQNLRMLLEQAQVALLSGNQVLYRESLQRAQHWVGEFSASDETAARAISAEITRLEDLTIASSLPDISRSVVALDAVMEQRLQHGGEQ